MGRVLPGDRRAGVRDTECRASRTSIKQIGVQPAHADSIEPWRAYFAYHLLRRAPPQLPEAFENENFDFWQRYLTGAKEQRPRTARCVAAVDRALGDLLGQKYIELTFGADAKAADHADWWTRWRRRWRRTSSTLPWMTRGDQEGGARQAEGDHQQRRRAEEVARLQPSSRSRATTSSATRLRAAAGGVAQRIERIGKPTDKTEWGMTTPTVNAFYSPQSNSINFPAGILQPPFFDPRRDIALNYGGAGDGDRPRDDARLRRPGPQVRWRRQPARLVDRRRRRRVRKARGLHRE